jgi:putative RecB family exonuclease
LQELLHFYNDAWAKNWNERIRIVRDEYEPENFRKMGEKFLSDYYTRYHPFGQAKTIGLEQKITLNLDPEGKYRITGVIDRLSCREDGTYEIHDYKTSQHLPTQDKKDRDQQLALYEIGIRQMWDDVEKVDLV